MAVNDLTADEMAAALQRIYTWRGAPDDAVACPRCQAVGLTVSDRSARPYSEFYALACPACGMDVTVHIPLAGPAAYS